MKKITFSLLLLSLCTNPAFSQAIDLDHNVKGGGASVTSQSFLAASIHSASSKRTAMALTFRGTEYEHRWSKNGQNEFTPNGETDLGAWIDMVTIDVHESVSTGDQLADLANKTLGNYKRFGKVLLTDSRPRTADHPAEHMVIAVLGTSTFLEAAFARFRLVDGVGTVIVYSHRIYGEAAEQEMNGWLKSNGTQVKNDLMAWNSMPRPAALKRLPQSD